MKPTHKRFTDEDDESEEYVPSNSEDDLDPYDKTLLDKVRKKDKQQSDSEDEVYGVYSDTSSDMAASDVEGQENEDDLPNVRAWGKDKRQYYSTDYVDPDYGGYQEKDATMAELEEEEAKHLQKYLMEQLDDEDFSLENLSKKATTEDKQQTEEIIKTDISKLSKRQKLALLTKESPELFGLMDDFKVKMLIVQNFLLPAINLSNENIIRKCEALEFVKTFHHLILNYCTNICMYMLVKASNVNVQNHPVVKRLYQYRQLLSQLEPIFEMTIKPQIENLLENAENIRNNKHVPRKKQLNILKKPPETSIKGIAGERVKKVKKVRFPEEPADIAEDENGVVEDEELVEGNISEESDEGNPKTESAEDSRRAITYQIAKNKGLTPRRNKMQRNPRVKHRNKYRKAKIRRKGAVREVRREVTRYGGEISGIKASVSKSIKIKV